MLRFAHMFASTGTLRKIVALEMRWFLLYSGRANIQSDHIRGKNNFNLLVVEHTMTEP